MREIHTARESAHSRITTILALGGIGSGKTTSMMTLPGKGFVYFFDPNGASVIQGADCDIDYAEFAPSPEEMDWGVKPVKKEAARDPSAQVRAKKLAEVEPRAYFEWEADFFERRDSGFFDSYNWIGMDSATTFSQIVMDRVQFLNKRYGKHPEQADYTAQMNTINNVVRGLAAMRKHLYFTAHIELMKDETTGKVYGQPVLTGKLRIRLPLLFSEILGFAADQKESGKVKYTIQTRPDRDFGALRSAMRGVGFIEDVTVDFNRPMQGQGLGGLLTKHELFQPGA